MLKPIINLSRTITANTNNSEFILTYFNCIVVKIRSETAEVRQRPLVRPQKFELNKILKLN